LASPALAPLPADRPAAQPRFYRPELDVLRFIAFFSVFIAHLQSAPVETGVSGFRTALLHLYAVVVASGAFGMCIFFLLSSYLITELLIRERDATGSIHLRAFYTRRILRIWPLYFGVVFAGYCIGLFMPRYALSATWVAAFVFLAANWYTGRVGYAPSTVGVLWSIPLEEQFYLLWPGIAKFGGIRALTIGSLISIPLGYGVLFYLCRAGQPMQPTLWTNSFIQFSFFGIGALLALALHRSSFPIPLWTRPILLGAGILLWLSANQYFHVNGDFYQPREKLVTCGFAVMAVGCVAIFLSLFGIARNLLPPPLIFLGKISYGLYVFHVPCREVARWLVGNIRHALLFQPLLELTLTVTVASLSYHYFEMPFLRLKKRFEFVKTR
jgi:peptidoglycan/LPS O-acetylase OafA/YrhL